jgi:hypothetical protein
MLIDAKELFAVVFDPVAKTVTVLGAKKFRASFRSIINTTRDVVFYASNPDGNNKTYVGDNLVFTTDKSTTGMAAADTVDVTLFLDDENSLLHAVDNLRLREAHFITADDDADIPQGVGFIVALGDAGNVDVVTAAGQNILLTLEKNELFPMLCRRVKATLTTATGVYMVR